MTGQRCPQQQWRRRRQLPLRAERVRRRIATTAIPEAASGANHVRHCWPPEAPMLAGQLASRQSQDDHLSSRPCRSLWSTSAREESSRPVGNHCLTWNWVCRRCTPDVGLTVFTDIVLSIDSRSLSSPCSLVSPSLSDRARSLLRQARNRANGPVCQSVIYSIERAGRR